MSSASLGSTPPCRIASTPMRTSAIPRSSGSAGRSASGLEASETFSLDVMSFVSAFILAALAAVLSASVRPVTASSSRPRAIFAVVAPLVRSPRGLRRGLALVPGVIAGSARDTTSSLTSVPTMETVPPSLRLMAMGVGRGSRQMPERWARIGGKGCTHPSEGPTGRFVARAGEGNSPRRASPRGGGLGRQLAHQAAHRSSSPRASRVARNGSPVFFTTSERQQLVRTSRSPPSVVIS